MKDGALDRCPDDLLQVVHIEVGADLAQATADVPLDQIHQLLCRGGESANTQVATHHHDRKIGIGQQVEQVIIGDTQFGITIVQFFVERGEFFVAGLQLLLGGFQFFVGTLQLFIGGEHLFVGRFVLLRCSLMIFNQGL